MADRFYLNSPLTPGLISLTGPEAHHLTAVRRIRPGAQVCLFNGDGLEYPAEVIETQRKTVLLRVMATIQAAREVAGRVEIAAPLPKGDRAQMLIEKLTELGVTHFVPLQTRRSVVQPREAKLEKLQRHVIEASKQCGRNRLLTVGELTPWEAYARQPGLPDLRLLAQVGGETLPTQAQGDVACAVGPEGDFTPEEIELGQQHGWRLVQLGPRILRLETAALALAAWATLPRKISTSG